MLRRSKRPEISETALGLAQMAEQRLGELALTDGTDINSGIDSIVEDLTLEGRKRLLQGFFGDLSPLEQLNVLAARFKDETILGALESHRRIAASEAARKAMVAEVHHDAESGVLHLDKLVPDTRLQLDLYETADFKDKNSTNSLLNGNVSPNARLCFGIQNDGSARLTEYEINDFDGHRPNSLKRTPSLHEEMILGSPKGKTGIDPTLHWAAPVYHQLEQDPRPYPISMPGYKLGLGSIWVNGEHVPLNDI